MQDAFMQEDHMRRPLSRQTRVHGKTDGQFSECLMLFVGTGARGHSQMTSAERGREGITQILTQKGRLRDFSTIDWSKMLKRGGVKNPKNLADVICERPLF